MTKVVYNNCYGGFGLSREAVLLGRKLSNNPNWCGPCIKGDFWKPGEPVKYNHGGGSNLERTDPILVQVVEQLGERANGMYASLVIENVPEGTAYRIDEYDGR